MSDNTNNHLSRLYEIIGSLYVQSLLGQEKLSASNEKINELDTKLNMYEKMHNDSVLGKEQYNKDNVKQDGHKNS